MRVSTEPCPRCRDNGGDTRGDNLVRYADGGAHCFACQYHINGHGGVKDDRPPPPAMLPSDATKQIPGEAWKWLLQFGLPPSYWEPIVWWSEHDCRLIFAIGKPAYSYTGRYFGTEKRAKWFHYGRPNDSVHVLGGKQSSLVVLVEDLISAHRIAFLGYQAIPLFGTLVHARLRPILRLLGASVVLWLDQDQASTVKWKASSLASMTGLDVYTVVTEDDPKSLSAKEIRQRLDNL